MLDAEATNRNPFRRVFDCFLFFNELDLLDIRLRELSPLVDYFVLVEATRTFVGEPKPLHFQEHRGRFAAHADKIIHVVVDDMPREAATPWVREAHQRNAMLRGLKDAGLSDIIIVSDLDEIPKPHVLQRTLALPRIERRIVAFWTDNYFYRLNLRDHAHVHKHGPRLLTRRLLREPQRLRYLPVRRSKKRWKRRLPPLKASLTTSLELGTPVWVSNIWHGAWHFTCAGDLDAVNYKRASDSHSIDGDRTLTREAFERELARLSRIPLDELPASVRMNQERFAHLLA